MPNADNEFLELYKKHREEANAQMSELLYNIRIRNHLTQQFVSDFSGCSENGIYKLEKNWGVSMEYAMKVFHFYYSEGYTTKEDQERFRRYCGVIQIPVDES